MNEGKLLLFGIGMYSLLMTIFLNLLMFKLNNYSFLLPLMNLFYALIFAWYIVIGNYIGVENENN